MALRSVKLPDGSVVEIDEWLHWPQYSSVAWTSVSALSLRMFTYLVGQRVPTAGTPTGFPRNATEADTNQVARARMNFDESFIVFSMTYESFAITDDGDTGPSPDVTIASAPVLSAQNLRRLQRDMMMELFVGAGISKPQAQAPLPYYGQGCGAPAWASGDTLTTNQRFSYGTGGDVSPRNQRRWNLPVYIESDRVMYVLLSSPAGVLGTTASTPSTPIGGLTQDIYFRVYLDGLKKRPVA